MKKLALVLVSVLGLAAAGVTGCNSDSVSSSVTKGTSGADRSSPDTPMGKKTDTKAESKRGMTDGTSGADRQAGPGSDDKVSPSGEGAGSAQPGGEARKPE